MNAEFIAMLDYLERERGIKREILIEAVSNALLSASKKSVGASRDLHIDIDPKNSAELMRRGEEDAWRAHERAGWLEPQATGTTSAAALARHPA